MRVDQFDYALPPELIAQEPAKERTDARLFVVEKADARIADLASFVEPGTLLVVNDTKVIPARILGTKDSGGKAEVFLVRKLEDGATFQRWQAMGRASKVIRPGTRVSKGDLVATFEGKSPDGLFEVRLEARSGASLDGAIRAAGQLPLPPYIKRDPSGNDDARYQTVFAKTEGAVAAPTAGLHLDEALMHRLRSQGCTIEACTLHVGLGTFQPVTVDDLDDHPMHSEAFEVSRKLQAAIAKTRENGNKVLAVGTTVVRALESAADPSRPGHVLAMAGETRILIQPGSAICVVDRLLTNFHLPKSTLLALVSAFAGRERILEAYAHAVRERYRFFSYGDAMLLDRAS